MSTLRERLIARAHEFASGHYTKEDRAELILEGARMALEEAAQVCNRRVMGDGNREDQEARRCADAIRALRDGLD